MSFSIEDLSQCGCPYKIYQDKDKFCFGIDAILLSFYASNSRGNRICDLCTGNGIIPIMLAHKTKAQEIHGLELQSEIVVMAQKTITLNHLDGRIKIYEGNLRDSCSILEKNSYDAVTANPPYMKTNAQTQENPKSIARQEIYCTLEDVIKNASQLLKSNGKFYMVHRPSRLNEIFVLLEKHKLGTRRMRLVQPMEKEKPTMILIEAEKCAHPELIVEPVLTVYSQPGTYTREIDEIYGRC